MRRTALFILLFYITSLLLVSQVFAQINHWEAVVNASNNWKYSIGTSEPPIDWINLAFNDSGWLEGPGGFGYGDNDDGTGVATTVSTIYLRKKFTIQSLAEIEQAVLLADYDDGFVAYLNGKEISRAGISGIRPTYNQYAEIDHEATLYQNLYPMEQIILKAGLADWIIEGENILCVQVHNLNATSTDLSTNFFLNVALNVSDSRYQSLHPWFVAPANNNSSNLPLVVIDTRGMEIPDEPKIFARMGIIDNGPGMINTVGDPFTGYNGDIAIEIRGSSSQMFPQKQYAIELKSESGLDTSASILGMPVEEDWILQGPYTDKSLMRNVLTYKLGAEMGWYAPRTRFCEVLINDQYLGVFFMTEKIKRDKNRVNISALNPDENSGDDLTGGYIVKIDKFDGASQGLGWNSPYTVTTSGGAKIIQFQYHYPAEDVITAAQANYIRNSVTNFESSLYSSNFREPTNGYRKYINVDSFIDFAIMNELTKNVDGYRLSTFLYKDRDSKDSRLYIGPLWDFNLAFGNADYCEGGKTSGWAWDFNVYCGADYWVIPSWWDRLLKDRAYLVQFRERWFELRAGKFSNEAILNYVDSMALALDEPQKRHYQLYPILSQYVWPNNYIGGSYANEINYMKNWITDRLAWLDNNIGSFALETGIEDLSATTGIKIYPNPSNGAFNIELPESHSGNIQFEIIDQLGKVQYAEVFKSNELPQHSIRFDEGMATLRSGLYMIKLCSSDRQTHTRKMIVK